ncbi:hypothetical protein LCGC14_2773990, partial [marine sediment metagenome]
MKRYLKINKKRNLFLISGFILILTITGFFIYHTNKPIFS